MKKFSILLVISFYATVASPQVFDLEHVEWASRDTSNYKVEYLLGRYVSFSDDTVQIKIRPNSFSSFWDCEISNISYDKIIVKWNEAVMGSGTRSRVVFGDTRVFQINEPNPDAIVYKGDFILKNISGEHHANSYFDMVSLKNMKNKFKKTKETQYCNVEIKIPIEFNGKVKFYDLGFLGKYQGKVNKK